ncbi:MAG TPA: divalent metal cation transporter, partial [Thermoplasmata archaeon]|nr:divalent metal cation transporter [Thermoplasmata archaeon]
MTGNPRPPADSEPTRGGLSLPAISAHLRAPRRWRGGPAWLVMIANVDAASILTALESGASYRYDLIWFLVALTVPLFFIQEASGRLGAVTQKGLGEVARQHYRPRLAATAALSMAAGDVATYVAEYAGIALGLSLFGIPPVVSLPLAFLAHIAIVVRGPYAWVERVLIGVSAGVVVSLAVVVLHRGLLPYSPFGFSNAPSFYVLLAANAGAVVMPFMLYFQSSATAAKKTSLAISRQSTLLGAVVSELLMIVVVMIGAGLAGSFSLTTAATFSASLTSGLGTYGTYVLGIGLVAAAFLALVVISLGSAWGVTEALGLSPTATRWIYIVESVPAVFIPLLFPDLVTLVLALMVAMVFILIVPGVFLGSLSSDRTVMGANASRGAWRWAYWVSLMAVVAVGVTAVV